MRGRMLLGGLPFIGAAFGRKCKAVLLGSDLLSSCAHFGALGLEAHRAALWQPRSESGAAGRRPRYAGATRSRPEGPR